MNLNDIMGNSDRQLVFDTILEEACRQWCAFFPDTPDRMDGEGFANFFYEIFEQKEAEYIQEAKYEQEAESKEPPAEKSEVHAAPPMEAGQSAQAAPTVTDSPPVSGPVQENQAVQEFMKLLMENRRRRDGTTP